MERISHTTKTGKAKCLAYRNGKRCGRVATVEVVCGTHRQTMCRECADAIVEQHGSKVVRQESRKGFTVRNAAPFSGMVSREYKRRG